MTNNPDSTCHKARALYRNEIQTRKEEGRERKGRKKGKGGGREKESEEEEDTRKQ